MSGRVSDLHIQMMEDRAARGEEPEPSQDGPYGIGYALYLLRDAIEDVERQLKTCPPLSTADEDNLYLSADMLDFIAKRQLKKKVA